MSGMTCTLGRKVRDAIVRHLVARIEATSAIQEPFTHVFLQNVFPDDIYKQMLETLPNPETYMHAADRHYGNGKHMRSFYNLSKPGLTGLPSPEQSFWATIASALTAEEVKCAMFRNLAVDLSFRYGVPEAKTAELPAYSRPVLYRETEGFEIPPHPDTQKVVTMHSICLRTRASSTSAPRLYRRRLLAWPFGSWQRRFEKVKQFPV